MGIRMGKAEDKDGNQDKDEGEEHKYDDINHDRNSDSLTVSVNNNDDGD